MQFTPISYLFKTNMKDDTNQGSKARLRSRILAAKNRLDFPDS
jgi:hypothetical protein